MNLYNFVYCKAFDWYNTSGKKEKESLRFSAIILISAFQIINLICLGFILNLASTINFFNKWLFVALGIVCLVANYRIINTSKSDQIRTEFENLSVRDRKRLKTLFIVYVFFTLLIFGLIIGIQIYLKNKYGRWLLHGYRVDELFR